MKNSLMKRIKRWISLKAEECRNVAPLYSYALDRKLGLLERLRIRFHLLTCNACRDYVDNINFMHSLLHSHDGALETGSVKPEMPPDARARIKTALRSKSPLE